MSSDSSADSVSGPHSVAESVPALSARGLTVRSRGQMILEDITFELEQGGFLGLIGPNGGGKTVFLKTVLGLIRSTSGTVTIFGRTPREARGLVSYVPQYASFDTRFPLTVYDTVLMGRLPHRSLGSPFSSEDHRMTAESLVRLGITDLRERPIGKLSGGQIQRALIARAIAARPRLLLLDEPTASLDSRIGRDVYEVLAECNETMTIILVSHDVGVISSHVKTIACLNRKLHYHHSKEISGDVIAEVYGCPVELIAHGHAHRVLADHRHEEAE